MKTNIKIGSLVKYRLAGQEFVAPVKNIYIKQKVIRLLLDLKGSTLWIDTKQIVVT